MGELKTTANISTTDDIYQLLIDFYDGCDEEECQLRSAKLILCLANHIGDPEVLASAIQIARGDHSFASH